jgi:adenosylcobinamide-phosphate synthase
MTPLALGLGYGLDLLFGDPAWLPHPVVGFGKMISAGERRLNNGSARARFAKGALLALGLVALIGAGVWALLAAARQVHPTLATGLEVAGVFYGLANRTLIAEGRAVFRQLEVGLAEGRRQLARIVGRDTAHLDAQQVRTATLETLAENLSDGVVAPLFWGAVAGLPGLLAYKMVNTLDSMIGHHDERYEWFGKTAARLDDVANWVPARLTAWLLVLVAGSARGARCVRRYGSAHSSPNSGQPEAAIAGILDLRFGGPHTYDGEVVVKPWIGENAREIVPADIERVVRLNHAVCLIAVVLTALVWHWRGGPA